MRVWIAIWVGSSALAGHVGEWLRKGVAARLLGLLLACGFIKGLPWTTQIAALMAAGWLVAAITIGLRHPPPAAAAPTASAAAEEPEDDAETADSTPLLDADELAAALHHIGAPQDRKSVV